MPPSTNNLFITQGRRRIVSPEYRDWRLEAGWKLKAQHPGKVAGRVVILIGVDRPKTAGGAASDIDNRIKALLDLLVKHAVIDDDKTVAALAIAWNPPGKNEARVLITQAHRMRTHFIPTADGQHGSWILDTEGAT